jgi:hypothetical protein
MHMMQKRHQIFLATDIRILMKFETLAKGTKSIYLSKIRARMHVHKVKNVHTSKHCLFSATSGWILITF